MRRAVVVMAAATACGRVSFDARISKLRLADPGEPLIEFALPVFLESDASDLQFFASDGTRLPIEIESLGVPGGAPLVAWVRVPLIAGAATTLTMRYGGGASSPTASVWDESYEAVWHLTDAHDSTPHQRDGVANGTREIDGVCGPARTFDATRGDGIVIAGLAGLGFSALTASSWMRFHTPPSDNYYALVTRELGDAYDDDFFVGTSGQYPFGGLTTIAGTNAAAFGPPIAVEEWHHLAMIFDGTQVAFFLDGALRESRPVTGTIAPTLSPGYIGCDRDNLAGTTPPGQCDSVFLDGELDEVRIESVARSPAWIDYTVRSMRDEVISYEP